MWIVRDVKLLPSGQHRSSSASPSTIWEMIRQLHAAAGSDDADDDSAMALTISSVSSAAMAREVERAHWKSAQSVFASLCDTWRRRCVCTACRECHVNWWCRTWCEDRESRFFASQRPLWYECQREDSRAQPWWWPNEYARFPRASAKVDRRRDSRATDSRRGSSSTMLSPLMSSWTWWQRSTDSLLRWNETSSMRTLMLTMAAAVSAVAVAVAANELAAPLIVSIRAEMMELTCYHEISSDSGSQQWCVDVSKRVEIRIVSLGHRLEWTRVGWEKRWERWNIFWCWKCDKKQAEKKNNEDFAFPQK